MRYLCRRQRVSRSLSQQTVPRLSAMFCVYSVVFQVLHEGPNSPTPKKGNTGIFSSLFSGPPNWSNFTHRFLLITFKMAAFVLQKIHWLWEKSSEGLQCRAANLRNTDQPSNIMIKCLFIFFKYQIFLHIIC